MKTAIICFTEGANKLAFRISSMIESDIFFNKRLDKKVKDFMEDIWKDYDLIIFISAAGIAVRYIAKYISGKDVDPAVLVTDECGNFVISLLSGHIGGANEFTSRIAEFIGAIPVITTASEVLGVKSIDMFALENDFVIEDLSTIARVMSRVVEGETLAVINDTSICYPYKKQVDYRKNSNANALLIISDKVIDEYDLPYTILRPKTLSVGIGCRRGTPLYKIDKAVSCAFSKVKLSEKSIFSFSSVDLKADETGLLEYVNVKGIPFSVFSADELSKVEGDFQKSDFVKNITGVDNVSSRAALMFADELILDKFIYDGVTVSIARRKI